MDGLKYWAIILIVAVNMLGAPASAQDDPFSANAILPGCKAELNNQAQYLGGYCAGVVSTLVSVNDAFEPQYQFCRPKGTTLIQDIQIVVNYLQAHPQQWQDGFVMLAHTALASGWPCSK